jgi:hypothetical protein
MEWVRTDVRTSFPTCEFPLFEEKGRGELNLPPRHRELGDRDSEEGGDAPPSSFAELAGLNSLRFKAGKAETLCVRGLGGERIGMWHVPRSEGPRKLNPARS